MIAKSFGEIPAAGPLEPVDEALLSTVRGAFDVVGGLIERQRFKQGIGEVMRVVGEANKYVADTEPFKLKGEDQRERLGTVLHVLAQAVSCINTLMAPFLPHGANRVHRVMGGEGDFVPMPRLQDVTDLDNGKNYPVIMGDYSATPLWEYVPVEVGTPIAKPTPVFSKFDPAVVEEEIERMRGADE
jgi:methionyl-tRNA synthetase